MLFSCKRFGTDGRLANLLLNSVLIVHTIFKIARSMFRIFTARSQAKIPSMVRLHETDIPRKGVKYRFHIFLE